jgi:hypothetical protein
MLGFAIKENDGRYALEGKCYSGNDAAGELPHIRLETGHSFFFIFPAFAVFRSPILWSFETTPKMFSIVVKTPKSRARFEEILYELDETFNSR